MGCSSSKIVQEPSKEQTKQPEVQAEGKLEIKDPEFARTEFDRYFIQSFGQVFKLLSSEITLNGATTRHLESKDLAEFIDLPKHLGPILFNALKGESPYLTKQVFFQSLGVICALSVDSPGKGHTPNKIVLPDLITLPIVKSAVINEARIIKMFIPSAEIAVAPVGQDEDAEFLALMENNPYSNFLVPPNVLKAIFTIVARIYCFRLSRNSKFSPIASKPEYIEYKVNELIKQIYRHNFGNMWDGNVEKPMKISEIQNWTKQNCRGGLFRPLADLLVLKFFLNDLENLDAGRPFQYVPKFAARSNTLTDVDCWFMSLFLPFEILSLPAESGFLPKLLYCASKDGFSMSAFESHVFKYNAPTLVLIRASPQSEGSNAAPFTIGVLMNRPWKMSKRFYGDEATCFFEIAPYPEAFPSIGSAQKPKEGSTTDPLCKLVYSSQETGLIGFDGYSLNNYQNLRFKTDFRNGTYSYDPSKESLGDSILRFAGPKASNLARKAKGALSTGFEIKFITDEVEVFGLGDEKAFQDQRRAWDFEVKEADKRANVNLKVDTGAEGGAKFILQSAGIGGNAEKHGISPTSKSAH